MDHSRSAQQIIKSINGSEIVPANAGNICKYGIAMVLRTKCVAAMLTVNIRDFINIPESNGMDLNGCCSGGRESVVRAYLSGKDGKNGSVYSEQHH